MPTAPNRTPTTRLSSKGQVILPKEVRERRRWRPGQAFDVVDTPEGVLLRPQPERADPAEVGRALDRLASAFNYQGPPVPIEKLGIEALPYREPYADEDE